MLFAESIVESSDSIFFSPTTISGIHTYESRFEYISAEQSLSPSSLVLSAPEIKPYDPN